MIAHTHTHPTVRSQHHFSIDDFYARWKSSRTAAIRAVIAPSNPMTHDTHDETDLLMRVEEKDRDPVLKNVFDNSRKLGISVVRYLGLSWETSDMADILKHAPMPCLHGEWQPTLTGVMLQRAGCLAVKQLGAFYCDYWREALDGFVMGVGVSERYARHASVGHGDAVCTDVFFDDALNHAGEKSRYGEMPEKLKLLLADVHTRFKQMDITLTLKGISEGVLYYCLESAKGPLCGDRGRELHASFVQDVRSRMPGLRLRDASPLAVYGEGTG